MGESDGRAGEPIYEEGKIEVRTFPRGIAEHSLWIGEHYFLLQRGCLEQFAARTSLENLEETLKSYNSIIPYTLEKENVSLQTFALVLARAQIKELETQLDDAYNQVHNLSYQLAEK